MCNTRCYNKWLFLRNVWKVYDLTVYLKWHVLLCHRKYGMWMESASKKLFTVYNVVQDCSSIQTVYESHKNGKNWYFGYTKCHVWKFGKNSCMTKKGI